MAVAEMMISGVQSPMLVRLPRKKRLSEHEFFELCGLNPDLRIEMDREGLLLIMPPAMPESGAQELEVGRQLANWVVQTGLGRAFGPSTGFQMPVTRSQRSPDASWLPTDRVALAMPRNAKTFPSVCPDFVVELRSRSDRLQPLLPKMEEYRENGARLGWLIDPLVRKAYVYRPDAPVQVLSDPAQLSGDPVLPGFVLDLTRVWG